MRASGVLTEPVAAGPADHVCCVYDTPAAFADVAGRFLSAGLARGERLVHAAGAAGLEELRRSPGALGPLAPLEARGVLSLLSLDDAYGGGAGFVPEEQLAYYDAATRTAVAAGFTGLRVVADVTSLAADAGRRAELIRWEHLADEFMATGSGMSALCAYRRGAVEPDVLTEVATVHPQLHTSDADLAEELAPFRVHVEQEGLVLSGSVDTFVAGRLRHVLAGSHVERAGTVVLDLSRLEFTDAAGCRAIAGWAADRVRQGRRVQVVGASRLFARVWELLGEGNGVVLSQRPGAA